ncbi:hypothetical protein IEQ34_012181 [Dendrobium chrysotoxum]|uniref:Uncharacterized protein n=1 Tax=Dendrobium chrysotoxum TaxID=161865 RepID=A0AAV7GT87_DENCH|nr:hypothetical protein IEQ34_012181 [Dendrobium chrysotoxum]
MAIQEHLRPFKLHFAVASVAAIMITYFIYLGPTFSSLVGFFWPLLLSTTFLLAAVAVILRISPPPHTDAAALRAGDDIIDFVAGTPYEQLGGAAALEERPIQKPL